MNGEAWIKKYERKLLAIMAKQTKELVVSALVPTSHGITWCGPIS